MFKFCNFIPFDMVSLNEDRVEIILMYGQGNRNYHDAARLFNDVFPVRPNTPSYVKIHYIC